MSRQVRKLHLFNCDRTYDLDAVEDLLNATKAKRPSLDFDPVKQHYFSLAQMHEMTTKVIPELQMDIAFFVVHANESRLSINEDNAGIGYAKIYKALLGATGGKVIIIIGGDDNYTSEDEEDRVVISRWAKRKIHSQFSDDFLDGSKSFIFSWNKKHREIHEEALLHYFDSSKEGQKFEYQPKPRQPESVQSAQTTLSGPYHSTDEQRGREGIGSSNSFNAERHGFAPSPPYSADQTSDRSKDVKPREVSHPIKSDHRGDDVLFSPPSSTGQSLLTDHSSIERRREGSISSDSRNADQRRDGPSLSPPGNDTSRVTNKAPVHQDLAILCCNVSEDSLHAVMEILPDFVPKLNLLAEPPVENLSPDKIKDYLKEFRLKACVLVVDGKTVNDAYKNLPRQREEYRGLLETAANRVVEKVIILICDTCFLPSKDEEIVSRTIEDIITRRGKGYIAWLKKGKLSVEPDVLVECLRSTSPAPQSNPQTNSLRASQEKNRDAPGSVAELLSTNSSQSQSGPLQRNPSDWGHMQQAPTTIQPLMNTYPAVLVTGEPVWLRSILRYGRISFEPRDLQLWDPAFIVPDFINTELIKLFHDTPEIGVKIVQAIDGQLQCFVDPKLIEVSNSRYKGIKIAANETLKLKTRILKGLVSFQDNDLDFRCGSFRMPQEVIDKLKEEHWATPCGVLHIISDEIGNLRSIVKIGKLDRFLTFVNKR